MFSLSADILIKGFKPIKPHAITWKRSIDNYSDTATVKIPALAKLKTNGDRYEVIDAGQQFSEGTPIEIQAGYNGKNQTRFRGFIRRINYNIPLELECEGYSYPLRLKEGYTKSYAQVSLKQLLSDLVQDTDIKLSTAIPDVQLRNIYFKNAKGTDVLEYLKEKCLLTVHFNFDELYAGLQQVEVKSVAGFRLGWNTVEDNELKFERNRELAKVNIVLEQRNADGTKRKAKGQIKDGAVKTMKVRHLVSEDLLKKLAEEKRKELVFRGYEGKISAFLIPYVEPGMGVRITDDRYPERSGSYYVTAVEGSLGPQGGRQKISIGQTIAA